MRKAIVISLLLVSLIGFFIGLTGLRPEPAMDVFGWAYQPTYTMSEKHPALPVIPDAAWGGLTSFLCSGILLLSAAIIASIGPSFDDKVREDADRKMKCYYGIKGG